ncbi:MAG: YeeE/YedE family protein [Sulfurovum sp.]|nr:YeeE/YedE family protein [Sulfurovum sp.]MCB4746543.1 YeeE/YedE family protein [Sulfurovum sp.]MCB4747198.1 YeeE/YedE family protein [Sulfurovum sp.]MCB4749714.1 YeeE/YedE family protein [Sulfurovum sp.]MCB4758197.1 YeeE/YedE family protein [Sulfurovum sp.]
MNRFPWWAGGILMAGLLLMTFSILGADRPLGASTYVPYFAGILFDLSPEKYSYLKEIENPGAWEGVMLLGVFFGGFVTSVFITKSFRISLIPTGWKKYKNNSVPSRLFWSFVSGFMMIIGARLAGGCTSGHFISGMSQIAISSMIFGVGVMISLVITGRLFYNMKEKK